MKHRALVAAVAIAISFTGSGYVRRTWLPQAVTVTTDEDGSRDRALAGKARRRARRARP